MKQPRRNRIPVFVAFFSTTFSFLYAGSGQPDDAVIAGMAWRGESVYLRDCAACHGEKGDGKSPAAQYLDPKPRDFTAGMFKFRSTPSGELPTDADLLRVVEKGVPGTQMPAWKNLLTGQERADVVAYVKTFAADFKDGVPAPAVIPQAPASSPESIREGRYVYILMQCWACHGGNGKGAGKAAATLKDDFGNPIKPQNLTHPRYKAGNDPASQYRTFTTGLNGTPMPAYDASGFLIGGDTKVDPAKYQEAYSTAEIDSLRNWLHSQPTEADMQRLNEDSRHKLVEKRKWALVHYVWSIQKEPNFFVRMFTENTEVTP